MAEVEQENAFGMSHDIGLNSITLALAMVAGTGVVVMIVALAIGVIAPDQQDLVAILFVAGLLAMIGGSIAWAGVVRPFENFDDINIGTYEGHHHEEHDDEHDDEHAEESAESAH